VGIKPKNQSLHTFFFSCITSNLHLPVVATLSHQYHRQCHQQQAIIPSLSRGIRGVALSGDSTTIDLSRLSYQRHQQTTTSPP